MRTKIIDLIKFYDVHKLYMLAGFCSHFLQYCERVKWDQERILRSLKANYDHDSDHYYSDLIIELAGMFGGFDAMLKMKYNKVQL